MTLDRREVVALSIEAPLRTVWAHLRHPDLIARWFRWDSPELPAAIRRTFVEEPTEGRTVVGDATTHTLSWPNKTVLSITAAAHEPGRTHLVVTRSSHDSFVGTYDGVRDEVDEDWITNCHQLAFALEKHHGLDRRTLAVFGLDAGQRRERLIDSVGLHGVRGIPIGGHVEGRRPDGTLLGGTLVYRTEFQIGLQLHGITEAFLVVQETPSASHPPNGTLAAILSTYGVDDVTFLEVEERWMGWWRRAHAHPVGSMH